MQYIIYRNAVGIFFFLLKYLNLLYYQCTVMLINIQIAIMTNNALTSDLRITN
jgi:hypothetical protein